MKRFLRYFALGLILSLCIGCLCTAYAEAPEAAEEFYVLDQAGVLSQETKDTILTENQALKEAYGIQIVVVTVPDLGETDIITYTGDILSGWEVGGEAETGMVLVLDIGGENYFTIAGKGLREHFTSTLLKGLLDTHLEPDFAQEAYDSGVAAYFSAVANEAAAWAGEGGIEKAASAPSSGESAAKSGESASGSSSRLAGLWLFLAGLGLIAVSVAALLYCRSQRRSRPRQGRFEMEA